MYLCVFLCYYLLVETEITLREVISADLPIFFGQQKDPDSVYMAAFVFGDPDDRATFEARWARLLASPEVVLRTIEWQGKPAGHIASFTMEGQREITYWIGREDWGKGLATMALQLFLEVEKTRPLYARAAADNFGSCRVLEKCGFLQIDIEHSHAPARGSEIEERLYRLN